jgi:hypothetical protein
MWSLTDFLHNGTSPYQHDIFITPMFIAQDNLNEAERIPEIQ